MNYHISDNAFTIKAPVTITYPNGGQVFTGGQQTLISWRAATDAVSYEILYSTNGGAAWVVEANIAALNATKNMISKALDIGR